MTDDRHVTAAEAAVIFGVSRHTVYRWINAAEHLERTPVRSRGRHGIVLLYRLADLQQLAEQHRTTRPAG